MEHLNTPTASPQAPTAEDLEAVLRASLALEAEQAGEEMRDLYRWLGEVADAKRIIPSHGFRPYFLQIARELGVEQRLVSAWGATISRWHLRFLRTFSPEGERERFAAMMPDAAIEDTSAPGDRQERLVADLRRAHDTAPEDQRFLYDWLIARAEAGEPMPIYASRPNIRAVARLSGSAYHRVAEFATLLAVWMPRFDGDAVPAYVRRTSLPGTDLTGVEIPTGLLVKALRASMADEPNEDGRKLIVHLIDVAEGDRTVPRSGPHAAFKLIAAEAGVPERLRDQRFVDRIFNDWIGFFRLEEETSAVTASGDIRKRRNATAEVTRYVAQLRATGMTRLMRDRYRRAHISTKAIGIALNLRHGNLKQPGPRAVLEAYVEECRLHYGEGDGLGEPFLFTEEETIERKLFRRDLLDYIAKELKAGRFLPADPQFPTRLDYPELVRRFGRSGPDLSSDDYFRHRLGKLAPRYERYDRVEAPGTYGQLQEQWTAERLTKVTKKSSIGPTRSKIKGAFRDFLEGIGKQLSDQIGDDFACSDEEFTKMLNTIAKKVGVGQPEHWKGEMKQARAFLASSKASAPESGRLATILSNAMRADRRSYEAVARAVGMEAPLLSDWARGVALPRTEDAELVGKVERELGLSSGDLGGLVDSGRGSRKGAGAVRIPAGVRHFLPDDYRRKSAQELEAMIGWIEGNLLRQNTAFGTLMSKRQKRVHEEKRASGADGAPPAAPAASGSEPPASIKRALATSLKYETRGLGQAVVEELRQFLVHMTEFLPQDLDRRPGTHWKEESTAPMKLAMIARFLRWQILDEEEGGLGRDPDDLTLADLIHPPLVFAYLDYRARRNQDHEHAGRRRGKRFTGSDVDLVQTLRALVSDTYGFVTQSPEMAGRMRSDARGLANGAFLDLEGFVYDAKQNQKEDVQESKAVATTVIRNEILPARLCGLGEDAFRGACSAAARKYASAQTQLDTYAQAGRDPAEPIEGLLDQDQPMATLLRQLAIASLRTPAIENEPLAHHLHVRDLLICRLLAMTTLRSKNLRQITVDGDDPKLRLVPASRHARPGSPEAKDRWLLEIHWSEFKNFRSAVLFGRRRKRQPYRKYLPDSHGFYRLLDYYLKVSRPYLRGRRPIASRSELFLSSYGGPLDQHDMWKCVSRFTSRFVAWNPFREEGIRGVMPFGPHAFRDIRATDILLNPRTANPYLEAALALQSSPGMIQAHYGVVKTERRTAQDDKTFLASEASAWSGIDLDRAFAGMRLAA